MTVEVFNNTKIQLQKGDGGQTTNYNLMKIVNLSEKTCISSIIEPKGTAFKVFIIVFNIDAILGPTSLVDIKSNRHCFNAALQPHV